MRAPTERCQRKLTLARRKMAAASFTGLRSSTRMAGGREPGGGGGGGVWRVERGTVTDRSGGEHDTMDGRRRGHGWWPIGTRKAM
jgi:hypothetical protein